ncbi:MAG: BamA/TamA family outer membrane protein [Kofleriaceae bacterium]
MAFGRTHRARRGLAAAIALACGTSAAAAAPTPVPVSPGPAVRPPVPAPLGANPALALPGGDEFGAPLIIDGVEIVGNESTSAGVIERTLEFVPGQRMRADDRRLRLARYRLLALGFFREVALTMRRGAARGHVVIVVTVVERGTVVLNRLWFGTSTTSVGWIGADVSERNFLGTGVGVGGGAVYAARGGIDDSRAQAAAELRIGVAEVAGTRWSWTAAATAVRGSEPYRIDGALDDDAAAHFDAFAYRRLGVRAVAGYDVSAWTRIHVGARLEDLDATLPAAPTRTLPSGEVLPLDLHLRDGRSQVATVSVGLDRDTRRDPVLPHDGTRVQLLAEGGARAIAGDYHFATVAARLDRWWPVRDGTHAVGLRLAGAATFGDAPRFDRVHLSEVNRMITPRAMGLTVASSAAPDFLGTRGEDEATGEVGGSVVVEYVARLFRGGRHVFAGDLFVGAGAWALANRDSPAALGDGLPFDLVLDAGLRLDTELGIFELTLANALGRVAW